MKSGKDLHNVDTCALYKLQCKRIYAVYQSNTRGEDKTQ